MGFSEEQIKQLKAPMKKEQVSKRKAHWGGELSYIESWRGIDNANRIFGFDGWSCETVTLEIYWKDFDEDSQRWHISARAQSRVAVAGVLKLQTGHGHGINANKGLAVESAEKEAESDAWKRAARMFGNQFANCLYDKDQKNVTARETQKQQQPEMEDRLATEEEKGLLKAWLKTCKFTKFMDNVSGSMAHEKCHSMTQMLKTENSKGEFKGNAGKMVSHDNMEVALKSFFNPMEDRL